MVWAMHAKVRKHAADDWFIFCREVYQCPLFTDFQLIGGISATVEIDESKFSKMKGKENMNELWVLGGIERGTNKCFFRVVLRRTKDCLLAVIKERTLLGSIINSDSWKEYDMLNVENFEHLRVNHSSQYLCPETGTHSNTIEAMWSRIKCPLRNTPHRVSEFDSSLYEYI